MKNIALEHGIPVLQPESINTPEGIAALHELRPDLLVVAAYGQILSAMSWPCHPTAASTSTPHCCRNTAAHAPIAWAIYHGETRTGVTIIKMSVSLDAGDMLEQEATDIGPEETAGEVEARLARWGQAGLPGDRANPEWHGAREQTGSTAR